MLGSRIKTLRDGASGNAPIQQFSLFYHSEYVEDSRVLRTAESGMTPCFSWMTECV